MDRIIEYELIRSSRKSVSIRISPEGKVIVRAPMRLAKYKIDEFVLKNADWIEKTTKKVFDRNEQINNIGHFTPEELNELKKLAKDQIVPMVKDMAQLIGVTYGRVTFRAQKSRWGSCTRDGNLNFNCLLILTPVSVRRYVVVHELCHRKEMNHSAKFWAEVEKIIPDYKEQRKWLKKEGSELILRLP